MSIVGPRPVIEKETRLLIVADLNRLIASNDKTIANSKDTMEKDMFTKLPYEIDRWYKATSKNRIYSGMVEHIETDLSDFNDSIEKIIYLIISQNMCKFMSDRNRLTQKQIFRIAATLSV